MQFHHIWSLLKESHLYMGACDYSISVFSTVHVNWHLYRSVTDQLLTLLSRRAVVSREAKKKQHARAFQAYATTTVSYLHGWSV